MNSNWSRSVCSHEDGGVRDFGGGVGRNVGVGMDLPAAAPKELFSNPKSLKNLDRQHDNLLFQASATSRASVPFYSSFRRLDTFHADVKIEL